MCNFTAYKAFSVKKLFAIFVFTHHFKLLYELLTKIESNISGCGNSKTINKRRRGGVAAAASVMAVRDRPELIFINSAETETGAENSNVVSAENETEAECNALFRPKPKPKINNAECIMYVCI